MKTHGHEVRQMPTGFRRHEYNKFPCRKKQVWYPAYPNVFHAVIQQKNIKKNILKTGPEHLASDSTQMNEKEL